MPFIERLVDEVQAGKLWGWPALSERVRTFFTPQRMEAIDAVVPGWREMASFSDEATLIHIMAVFMSLLMCPEYQQADAEQQALMKWIVLFHDLGKETRDGKRDPTHAFKSAALGGRLLPRLGFAGIDGSASEIDAWAALTSQAVTKHRELNEDVQDNQRLPEIVTGIERLFGQETATGLIVRAVLLHMSVNVLTQWPQFAPLTEHEIRQYLDSKFLPLLKIMMLVDNDAYAFFDPDTKQQHRAETLAAFKRASALIVAT
jgi:hypothetical protein